MLLLPCMQERLPRERECGLSEAKAGRQASIDASSRVESHIVSPSPSPHSRPRFASSRARSRFVSSCCAYTLCCRGSSQSTLRRSVGRLSEWVVCALIVSAAAAHSTRIRGSIIRRRHLSRCHCCDTAADVAALRMRNARRIAVVCFVRFLYSSLYVFSDSSASTASFFFLR